MFPPAEQQQRHRNGEGECHGSEECNKAAKRKAPGNEGPAQSAASAAGEVLSGRAIEAVGHAAKSMLRDDQKQRPASADVRSERPATRERDQAH
jgi:hypothetical protein